MCAIIYEMYQFNWIYLVIENFGLAFIFNSYIINVYYFLNEYLNTIFLSRRQQSKPRYELQLNSVIQIDDCCPWDGYKRMHTVNRYNLVEIS